MPKTHPFLVLCHLLFFVPGYSYGKNLGKMGLQFRLIPNSKLKELNLKNKIQIRENDQIFSHENQRYRLVRDSKNSLQAQNLNTGRMGTVPGIIVVKLKESADFSNFVNHTHFQISSLAPQIHRVFLKIKNLENPTLDIAELAQHPDVERAEIDVVESRVSLK